MTTSKESRADILPEAANARLLAAAEVMADALRCADADLAGFLAECPDSGHPGHTTREEIRAALALIDDTSNT